MEKYLCKHAKESLQAEKGSEQALQEKTPQAILTELFLEIKTDQTPAVHTEKYICHDLYRIFYEKLL